MPYPVRAVLCLATVALTSALLSVEKGQAQPIDLYHPATWERPVLIAHRGGVITPEAPENSAAAVRLAADQGFAMVEVDVRESKDHVPVAFHENDLSKATGIDARISDLTLKQIKALRHLDSHQEILTLDQFLALCAQLDLGVMLDIKTDGSELFFREIAALLDKYGLNRSAVTFAGYPLVLEYLKGHVMFAVTEDEVDRVKQGEEISLAGKFWFGLPRQIDLDTIKKLQSRGALVIPAINTFRYPADENMVSAKEDVERMTDAGVDAFQIDAVYAKFFRTKHDPPAGNR